MVREAKLDGFVSAHGRNVGAIAAPLGAKASSATGIGTADSPTVALLRSFLFPVSATLALLLTTAAFAQPFTRPYLTLAVLAFALSWRLLGDAKFHELKPSGPAELSFPQVLLGWGKVFGILLFIGFAAKTSAVYSRAVLITWAIATPLLFAALHTLAYRSLCRWNTRGRIARTHIIVGCNAMARELAERLERDPTLGKFIGFFDCDTDTGKGVLGGLEAAPDYVRRNSIDAIHIAWSLESHPRLQRLLEELRDTTASVYFLIDLPSHEHCPARLVDMAGMPLLAYFETPHSGLHGVTKRTMDLAITLAALLVLWPVLLAVAIAVRLDSPGPIIFKQRRYGLNGDEFAVYKFRTMTVLEDGDRVVQARPDDARVTRVGRFLRRTSLDELPQLFCVLTGSMSLVGPRPHAVAHNEQYRRLIRGYMSRHIVRPGITGWAQVNGLRGETRTLEQMRARVSYDLEYLRHWSPWIDLKILLRTALIVLRDRSAY
jgi:putative colanic acid biosysnthesis UDP-glucose lipid carrier transferase